jgi:hypothetical protein
MKKDKGSKADDMRPGYKRSDFKKLERGKFYKRVMARSNVVILKPDVAAAFPNSEIVNETLSTLLTLTERSSRSKPRRKRQHAKIARTG